MHKIVVKNDRLRVIQRDTLEGGHVAGFSCALVEGKEGRQGRPYRFISSEDLRGLDFIAEECRINWAHGVRPVTNYKQLDPEAQNVELLKQSGNHCAFLIKDTDGQYKDEHGRRWTWAVLTLTYRQDGKRKSKQFCFGWIQPHNQV